MRPSTLLTAGPCGAAGPLPPDFGAAGCDGARAGAGEPPAGAASDKPATTPEFEAALPPCRMAVIASPDWTEPSIEPLEETAASSWGATALEISARAGCAASAARAAPGWEGVAGAAAA